MPTLVTTHIGRPTFLSGPLEHLVDVTALCQRPPLVRQFIGYRWSDTGEPFVIFGSGNPSDSGHADGLGYHLSQLTRDDKAFRHAAAVSGIEEGMLRQMTLDNLPYDI